MSRIKILSTPTLVVNAAGTGFDAPTDSTNWPLDSTTAGVKTPLIDGEILKVVINFTAVDTSANLTVSTRDTPSENIVALSAFNWATTDVTLYPLIEGLLNTNGAAAGANKTNVFQKYAVRGSLLIDCADATDNDTVKITFYYR